MKKLNIRFETDDALQNVEVLVRASERDEQVNRLLERISACAPDLLLVTDIDGKHLKLPLHDVISVSVLGKQTKVLTRDGIFTVRQPLQSLEERLPAPRFVRISRYEIVNIDMVLRFDFTLSGTLKLELVGGHDTWASRRNIPALRKALMEERE